MTVPKAPDIVLASSSPRRKELLDQLGLTHRVIAPHIDESVRDGEAAHDYALRTAEEKARWVAGQMPAGAAPTIVLAADTVVSLDEHVLGKPVDEEDARRMLRLLAGKTHQVMTGVCLLGTGSGGPAGEETFLVATDVEVKPLTEEEISAYVATGEPMDKAGAYAIQGRAGYLVRAIHGSYTNVVGLPLTEVAEALVARFDYPLFSMPGGR